MSDLRQAAQQALEALDSVEWYGAGSSWIVDADAVEKSITALKAALAAPEGRGNLPPPLPVAWMHIDAYNPKVRFLEWTQQAKGYRGDWIKTALYTTPPQRKPLSEDVIKRVAAEAYDPSCDSVVVGFARAIEQAHGISGAAEPAGDPAGGHSAVPTTITSL